ncbi:MAG: hypothetical protein HY815_14435 [Candidatus Riflebacteria bacterium]|nr:hypothetical protein [Candidatus Riflebacteria bacterium]
MSRRICIHPCLGVNEPLAAVGRQASYLAHRKLGKARADLGCSPALFADVEEDLLFVRNGLVIVVEACPHRCATHLITQKGGTIHATVDVGEVLARVGVPTDGLPNHHLPLDHPAVVAVADEIVRIANGPNG